MSKFKKLFLASLLSVIFFPAESMAKDEPTDIPGTQVIGTRGCPEDSVCVEWTQYQPAMIMGPQEYYYGGGGDGGADAKKEETKEEKERCKAELTPPEVAALLLEEDFTVLRGSSCTTTASLPDGWVFATQEQTDEYREVVGNVPGVNRCGGRIIALVDTKYVSGHEGADCAP